MSSDKKSIDGQGGSTVVHGDGTVKHTPGTLNPGDPGYREAINKAPVKDAQKPGTFNRLPTFRDLEEKPKAPKTEKVAAEPAHSNTTKGGSR